MTVLNELGFCQMITGLGERLGDLPGISLPTTFRPQTSADVPGGRFKLDGWSAGARPDPDSERSR